MFFPIRQAIAAALAAALHHGLLADTVELVNGDVLTGTVMAQEAEQVVFMHPHLGRLTLPAQQVKAVTLDPGPLYEANPPQTEDEDESASEPESKPEQAEPAPAQAQAAEPEASDKPEPAPAPETPDAAVASDAALEAAQAQESKSLYRVFVDEWETKLTLGFTGTSGNADRQNYHVKLDTEYETSETRWTINSGFFYAVANAQRTQNEVQTRITRDWLQADRPWFFFIRGEHEYDQFRTWENRVSGFGGAGYTLIDEDDFEVNTRMGFGGTYEFGEINDFTPEALFGGSVAKWKITPRQTLSGETIYYPSLEDESDFRIQTKLEWLYKLDVGTGLSLKIGMQNEYESLTPGDKSNNDFKYYGALVIGF